MMEDGDTSNQPQAAINMPHATGTTAPDLSFLANYPREELEAIGKLFISGALQLPSVAHASQQPPSTKAAVATPSLHTRSESIVPSNDQALNRQSDLEDGEISEEVGHDRSQVPESARSRSMEKPSSNAKRLRSDSPASGRPPSKKILMSSQAQEQLEDFVRVMHESGFTYKQLKSHVSAQDKLAALYKKLSLPTEEVAPVTAPVQPAVSTTRPQQATAVNVVQSQPAPLRQPAPTRQEYLAKLQAAKNKKTEVVAPAVPAPVAQSVRAIPAAEQNRMIRERIAALQRAKDEQADSANDTTPSIDVDQFLSSITPKSPVNGTAVPPFLAQSREPFDSDASRNHSLVIPVSDDEEPESEVDDSAIDDSGIGGVHVNATTSRADVSGSNTPGGQTYEQKMQELEDLRKRLADLEERKRSKRNGQQVETSLAIAATVSSIEAAQSDIAKTASTLPTTEVTRMSGLPGLSGASTAQVHITDLQPAEQIIQIDGHVEIDDAAAESDFEDIYSAVPVANTPADVTTLAKTNEEESDWTGTASETSEGVEQMAEDPTVQEEASSQHDAKVQQDTVLHHEAIPQNSNNHQPLDQLYTDGVADQPDAVPQQGAVSQSDHVARTQHEIDLYSDSDSCSMDMSEDEGMDSASERSDLEEEHKQSMGGNDQEMGQQVSIQQNEHMASSEMAEQHAIEDQVSLATATAPIKKSSFVPYHWPLKALKRYRFHPHLATHVPTAWRSATWTHSNSNDILVPVATKSLCKHHDDLPPHIHWDDFTLYGGEYLADLAWNPGWDEQEREEWDKAMQAAAAEQGSHTAWVGNEDSKFSGPRYTEYCDQIIAKHAQAWTAQVLARNCQQYQ